MNTNVKIILNVVEEIKEKLTDYQYKTVMDNLMILNNDKAIEEDYEDVDAVLDQIGFLHQYIPSLTDEDTKKVFINRLDLLTNTVFSMIRH